MKMPSFRKPSAESVQHFLERQRRLNFTYSAIGATTTQPPPGYVVDHTRIKLGSGEKAFEGAKAAIRRWQHFQLGWVEAVPNETPIEVGAVIGVLARVLGFWWLNACRIVYVIDEARPITRFGFVYGTLPGHAESGEERFQIEWNRSTNEVWYDILAFSRPNYFVTKVGYPVVRRFQKKFARDSAAAMVRAVQVCSSSVKDSKSWSG